MGAEQPELDRLEVSFPAMGTEAHVVLLGAPASLLAGARARIEQLEQRWSRFLPDSEISQLNRAEGAPVVVSPETVLVVAAALEAWAWSGGRFDPTVGRTMELAGAHPPGGSSTGRRPAVHVPCPTPTGIVVDPYPGSVTVPEGVVLDLGGIGKGMAADLVAAEVIEAGALGCCINLGGDIRVAGRPPRPEGWRISIDPLATDDGPLAGTADQPADVQHTVGVVDGAICTSTGARRTWRSDHGAEHHLRDPATGAPLRTGLAAVTVIAARAAQAEVLTKTAFGAGVDGAARVIADGHATGLLVTDRGATIPLDGLDRFLAAGRRVAA